MPVTKSAIKAMKQNRKANERNKAVKADFRSKVKIAKKSVAATEKDFAKNITTAIQAIDKAAKGGIIHKNTASRRKSRLMLALNKVAGKTIELVSIKEAPKTQKVVKVAAAKKTPAKKAAPKK